MWVENEDMGVGKKIGTQNETLQKERIKTCGPIPGIILTHMAVGILFKDQKKQEEKNRKTKTTTCRWNPPGLRFPPDFSLRPPISLTASPSPATLTRSKERAGKRLAARQEQLLAMPGVQLGFGARRPSKAVAFSAFLLVSQKQEQKRGTLKSFWFPREKKTKTQQKGGSLKKDGWNGVFFGLGPMDLNPCHEPVGLKAGVKK